MLLTHGQPAQMLRLVNRLGELFDNPPIVCHHDFGQSDLAGVAFPSNVRFVRPYVRTSWGTFSLVDATLRLLHAMYGSSDAPRPRWAVLLSAADYPVKSPERVLQELDAPGVDAHIQHKRIDERALDADWYAKDWHRQRDPGEHFVDAGKAYEWYRTVTIPVWGRRLWKPALTRPFLPFSPRLHCYAGSQWFTLNERAARKVLEFSRTDVRVARHYRRVMVPDESYFQTVLANMPDVRLNNANWRYTEWHVGQGHPKSLALEDLGSVASSGAHFARKVEPGATADLLEALDALCR